MMRVLCCLRKCGIYIVSRPCGVVSFVTLVMYTEKKDSVKFLLHLALVLVEIIAKRQVSPGRFYMRICKLQNAYARFTFSVT